MWSLGRPRSKRWSGRRPGEVGHLDVQVPPADRREHALLGASISFTDVTRSRRLQGGAGAGQPGLEDAYAELQSTNEELETTNEELQSTVEELGTTDEELQSTNEELKTMNEELQSTNEELQTINDELGQRPPSSTSPTPSSSRSGRPGGRGVVLETDLRVLVWNTDRGVVGRRRRRSRASTSSTWTSACPSTRSS